MSKTRNEALALVSEYTQSDSLIKHMLGVEAAMRFYARKFGEDEELWGITGLLHDFDYEKFPDPNAGGHPYSGAKILADSGYTQDVIDAIMGHATYTGVARESLMAKALFAVDELSGLITAAVYVRPDKSIHNLEVASVKKKLKDKAFARGVNREDVKLGVEELGIPLEEHIQNVIDGMREKAADLGLNGA